MDNWTEYVMVKMIENSKIIDADAWVRKYLVAASVERGLDFVVMMGIIASILISRPIHISSQCELSRVISVPIIRVE